MPSAPTVSWSKLVATGACLVMWPVQLWLSGDWRWAQGWLFGLWFVALCTTCIG